MESFYGGKMGFPFILRPNPDDAEHGYWQNIDQISNARDQKKIHYGDYVVITNEADAENHGKIYRINQKNALILVGKIGNPAPLYPLELIDDDTNVNFMHYPFLPDEESKEATGVEGYWKNSNGTIGLGFDFPRPIIRFDNVPSDNFANGTSSGIVPASDNNEYQPMNYHFLNVTPPTSYIGTKLEKERLSISYFNEGDLWLQAIDRENDDTDTLKKDLQKTILLNTLFQSSETTDEALGFLFSPPGLNLQSVTIGNTQETTENCCYLFPYRGTFDYLLCDLENSGNDPIIIKGENAKLYYDNKPIDGIQLNFVANSLLNNTIEIPSSGSQSNIFYRWLMVFKQKDSNFLYHLHGIVGQRDNFFFYWYRDTNTTLDEALQMSPPNAEFELTKIFIYNRMILLKDSNEIKQQCLDIHNEFRASDFASYYAQSQNNITKRILPTIQSFGITWYFKEVT